MRNFATDAIMYRFRYIDNTKIFAMHMLSDRLIHVSDEHINAN